MPIRRRSRLLHPACEPLLGRSSAIDPLHLSIALGPLAVYVVLLGLINISRRPLMTSGARDLAALGLALSGWMVVGPMELFLPEAAANRFGPLVWALLIALYALGLTLVVLLARPRLIIYNVTTDQLRPVLAEIVGKLDPQARWAGDCVVLPTLGVQFHIEPFSVLRVGQLIAAGPYQNDQGWKRLESELGTALKQRAGSANPHGYVFVATGLATILLLSYQIISNHHEVVRSLNDILRW